MKHWCQLKEIIGAESLILSSQSQFWQGLERTRLVAKILKLTRMPMKGTLQVICRGALYGYPRVMAVIASTH
jgi:hypothetical protein